MKGWFRPALFLFSTARIETFRRLADEQVVKPLIWRTAFLVIIFVITTTLIAPAQARRGDRITLEPNTTAELTVLLSAVDGLHTGLTKHDDEQIDVLLRDIEVAARKTIAVSVRLKPYERTHLVRNIESIDASVGVARNSGQTDRRERITDIFNTAANLVRVYAVDSRYKIFFCARDKMTWIQTQSVGRYPFPETGERECALRAP